MEFKPNNQRKMLNIVKMLHNFFPALAFFVNLFRLMYSYSEKPLGITKKDRCFTNTLLYI